MISIVQSKNGIPIRPTDERWTHVTEEHCVLAGMRDEALETLFAPDRIYVGEAGEQLAARELEPGKWMVCVYRELVGDGFVITAFLTRRIASLERGEQCWP